MKELVAADGRTYRLDQQLGAGGMGVVWRATAPGSPPVAIKCARTTGRPEVDERNRRMLREELASMRQIGRGAGVDRLVPVLDHGTEPELFFVMPLFDDTLRAVTSPQQDVRILFDGLVQACLAVEQLHLSTIAGQRLVHRDIKPENFLVGWEEDRPDVRLADFGGVKRGRLLDTATHDGLRTNGYAPPEQYLLLKRELDASVDVFALAVVVFEALTGTRPDVAERGWAWLNDDGRALWRLQSDVAHHRDAPVPDDERAAFEALRRRPPHTLFEDPDAEPLPPHEAHRLRNGLHDRLLRAMLASDVADHVADAMADALLPLLRQALHVDPDRRTGATQLRRACLRAERRLAKALGVDPWRPPPASAATFPPIDLAADTETVPRPVDASMACPYPGMGVFEERHASFFFGRDAAVAEILDRLKEAPLVTVVGASGSGKSSLVRAGVVPAVRAGALDGRDGWRVAVLRPGDRPQRSLAAAVLRLAGDDASRLRLPDEQPPVAALATRLGEDGALSDELAALDTDDAQRPGTLLVVDQLEEVFTEAPREEGRHVVRLLVEAARRPGSGLRVIMTLRADFLGRCLRWPELGRVVADEMKVLLTSMDRDQVREAVVRPAELAGASVDPSVVGALTREVSGKEAVLPLLQHCLVELWERREDDGTLSYAAYEAIGGLRGAVAHTAHALLGSLDATGVDHVRRVLGRLVRIGEDTEDTRRRAPLGEFPDDTADRLALDALVGCGLVTLHEEHAEIVHEALFREWAQLATWLDEEREALRMRLEVTEAAERHRREGEDPELLWRGARLERAVALLDGASLAVTSAEARFLEASVVEDKRRHDVEATRARRDLRRARWIAALAGGVGLLGVLGALALNAATQAEQQASDRANDARFAAADRAHTDGNVAAARWLLASAEGPSPVAWASQAHRQLGVLPPARAFDGRWGKVNALAFSRDGQRVATGAADGSVRVWSVEEPGPALVLRHDEWVQTVAFHPDGRLLVGGQDGALRLWTADGVREARAFEGHRSMIRQLVFSGDGARMYSAGDDGVARVWDVSSREVLLEVDTSELPVGGLPGDLSPDGSTLVVGAGAGAVRVFDVDQGSVQILRGHKGQTRAAFRTVSYEAGPEIVSTARDGMRFWTLDGQLRSHVAADLAEPSQILVAVDGSRVIAAQGDEAVLWSEGEPGLTVWTPVQGGLVLDLDVAPAGGPVATGGSLVWLGWPGRLPGRRLAGHRPAIGKLEFHPGGRWLASSSDDGSVYLWSLGLRGVRAVARGTGASPIYDGWIAADASTLVTRAQDGTTLVRGPDGTVQRRLQTEGRLVPHPPGRLVVTITEAGGVVQWSSAAPPRPLPVEGTVRKAAFSPQGAWLATGTAKGAVELWDGVGLERAARLDPHAAAVEAIGFSADEQRLAVAYVDGLVRVADVGGRTLGDFDHPKTVEAVALDRSGERLITGARDFVVREWSVGTLEAGSKQLGRHRERVRGARFRSDGAAVATWSHDGEVQIWSDGDPAPLAIPASGGVTLSDVTWSPDHTALLTLTTKGRAAVWSADGTWYPMELHHPRGVLTAARFDRSGQEVITAAWDGSIERWGVDSESLRQQLTADVEPCIRPEHRVRYLGEKAAVAEARWRGCQVDCWGESFEGDGAVERLGCPRDGAPLQPARAGGLWGWFAGG